MKLPWKKEDKSLLDVVKTELAEEYLTAGEERKEEIIREWMELDERSLEYEKIRAEHRIDAKTVFTNGVTIVLAGATLIFECSDVLRSKVTNLWLRRR